MRKITRRDARRFLLLRHGLLGERIYSGAEGVMDYIRRVGCVQFDPVNVCGRNADLALRARVKGYRTETLETLLYKERRLIDYWDKCMSIFPTEDRPHFERNRAKWREHFAAEARYADRTDAFERSAKAESLVREELHRRGHASSADLECLGTAKVENWFWGTPAKLSRTTLESMFYKGDLVVHSRQGTLRRYSLAEDVLPREILEAPDPCETAEQHIAFMVRRRIGAVGLLPNGASGAWNCVPRVYENLSAEPRKLAFETLLTEGKITPVAVEGFRSPLYYPSEEEDILERACSRKEFAPRVELLPPLDCLLWDRKLIAQIFDFDYTWEIYTPPEKRKFGAYTLPVLCGENFTARVEPVVSGGTLTVRGFWREPGCRLSPERGALRAALEKLARFHGVKASF